MNLSDRYGSLFNHSIFIYFFLGRDVIIHLKTSRLPRYGQALSQATTTSGPLKRKFKNLELADKSLPLVDFDPAQLFVTELR